MKRSATYYPNMDLLRYVLALGVIVAHYNELAGHAIPFPITSFESVGGFFALSGFLVYPSFEKHPRLKEYLKRRARRILPPYFFIVIACAIGLVSVSTLSAGEYFSSGQFLSYLGANLSFLNFLQPALPGVFSGSEYMLPAVNGSLWTMKIEWCLYLSVPPVVWLISRYGWNRRITALIIVLLSIAYRLALQYVWENTGSGVAELLSRQFFGQLSYFYIGVLIYLWRDSFRKHTAAWFMAGLMVYLLAVNVPYGSILLAPFAIGMIVLAISLTERTADILRHRYNVSYEMYLFHFPIIQLSICTGVNDLSPWISFPAILFVVILLSYAWGRLSLWHPRHNR